MPAVMIEGALHQCSVLFHKKKRKSWLIPEGISHTDRCSKRTSQPWISDGCFLQEMLNTDNMKALNKKTID